MLKNSLDHLSKLLTAPRHASTAPARVRRKRHTPCRRLHVAAPQYLLTELRETSCEAWEEVLVIVARILEKFVNHMIPEAQRGVALRHTWFFLQHPAPWRGAESFDMWNIIASNTPHMQNDPHKSLMMKLWTKGFSKP